MNTKNGHRKRANNSGGGGALIVHPETPARAVEGVFFSCILQGALGWRFDFIIKASPKALKLPKAVEPCRADGLLLQHTCFEVLLLDPSNGSYLEFKLSPSGQWAANRYDNYRNIMCELDLPESPVIFTTDPKQAAVAHKARMRALGIEEGSPLMQSAPMPITAEPPTQFGLSAHCENTGIKNEIAWRAAIAAVIEEQDGTRSHWALAHPPGKSDSHHEDSFVLELAPYSETSAARRRRK